MASALRILVPVKRVLDYTVSALPILFPAEVTTRTGEAAYHP